MTDERYAFVKSEANYFMDKCFQVSLGYMTALAAIGLATIGMSSRGLEQMGLSEGIASPMLLGALGVMLINVLYLTIVLACVFAMLKRGLFLRIKGGLAHREWETFVRGPYLQDGRPRFTVLGWNTDNYFMLPMFLLVGTTSIWAGLFAFQHSTTARTLAIGLGCAHLIPLAMVWPLRTVHSLLRVVEKSACPHEEPIDVRGDSIAEGSSGVELDRTEC